MTKPLAVRRVVVAGLLGAAAAAAFAGAPASAIDSAKPTPCDSLFLQDPAGDAEYDSNGTLPGGGTPGQPNMDIKGSFLNYRADKDGKQVLTTNTIVANLDKTLPSGTGTSGGVWYYSYWIHADKIRFVRAAIQSSGVTFAYGTVDPDLGTYTTDGDTAGVLFEGPDGVVQIDIPEDAGGKPGEKLGGLLSTSETIEGQDDFFGINHQADWTPTSDDKAASISSPNGKDYTVVACPAAPAATSTPAPTPAPGGGTTPPAPAPQSGPPVLPFKAAATLGSAKKAKKKKALAFKVTAGKAITGLKLALKDAAGKKPAVGTATIANLKAGTSTVKLKVSKKIKAGKYRLDATGTVDGQAASISQTVKLKK